MKGFKKLITVFMIICLLIVSNVYTYADTDTDTFDVGDFVGTCYLECAFRYCYASTSISFYTPTVRLIAHIIDYSTGQTSQGYKETSGSSVAATSYVESEFPGTWQMNYAEGRHGITGSESYRGYTLAYSN